MFGTVTQDHVHGAILVAAGFMRFRWFSFFRLIMIMLTRVAVYEKGTDTSMAHTLPLLLPLLFSLGNASRSLKNDNLIK